MNVVLVTIDTLRADRLRCYGNTRIDTPNLDRFARNGALFESAVCQVPLTAPSHASMMTGLNPTVHKVRDTGGFVLPPSHTTLAQILSRQGWDTAAFVGAWVLKRQFGFDRGFAVYDDEMPKPDAGKFTGAHPERRAAEVVDRALAWLNGQSGKPYFLWVHVFDPHQPYNPPAPFLEKYRDRPYDGEIAYVDRELGRLLDAVSRKSPRDTIVAVLSDHGESLADHGEFTHGVFLYDATLRIAFMMAGPGVPPGLRVKQQARTIDLLPTLFALMGGAAPGPVQGVSLVPALQGKDVPTTYSYAETLFPKINMGWAELRGVRTNQWKYIRAPKPELYELTRDPGEIRNVIAANPAIARELEARLGSIAGSGDRPEKVETAVVDQRTLNQLRSLGYLGGASHQQYELAGRGADPKDRLDIVKLLYLGASPDTQLPIPRRIAALREAARKDPANPVVYYHLGDLLGKAGRTGEAMKVYQEAVQNGIRSAWLFARLAFLYLQQGQKDEAIAAYERAVQMNPADPETLSDLATAYFETGRLADAERVFKWIQATGEEFAPAYNLMGLICIRRDDMTAARGYLEKAVARDPNLLEAQLNLGRIYKMIGANTRARACYEAFLAKASPAKYGQVIPRIREELADLPRL